MSRSSIPPGGLNFVADFRRPPRRAGIGGIEGHSPPCHPRLRSRCRRRYAPLVRRAGSIARRRGARVDRSAGESAPGRQHSSSPGAERQLRQLMSVVRQSSCPVPLINDRGEAGLEFNTGVPIEIAPAARDRSDDAGHGSAASTDGWLVFVTDAPALTFDDLTALVAAARQVAQRQAKAPQRNARSLPGTLAPTVDRAAALEAIRKSPQTAFEDHTGDLAATITGGHVYLHPHSHPGVTGALLTALAIGRPVVATDVSGDRAKPSIRSSTASSRSRSIRAASRRRHAGHRGRADMLQTLADASRRKAERRFDATTTNAIVARRPRGALSLGSDRLRPDRFSGSPSTRAA